MGARSAQADISKGGRVMAENIIVGIFKFMFFILLLPIFILAFLCGWRPEKAVKKPVSYKKPVRQDKMVEAIDRYEEYNAFF